jgi:hypothetical protein
MADLSVNGQRKRFDVVWKHAWATQPMALMESAILWRTHILLFVLSTMPLANGSIRRQRRIKFLKR